MTSVPSLVTIENDTPLADSRQIAKNLGMTSKNFRELLQNKQEFIEKHFGFLRFETAKLNGRGRPEKYALLTEEQSYYALTFCENTDAAMELRALLIKAFMDARKQLAQLITPSTAIPLRPDLAERADIEGLTPRCIRMLNLWTMLEDIWESSLGPDTSVSHYLMDQWIAEAKAMTPEDDRWGRKSLPHKQIHLLK